MLNPRTRATHIGRYWGTIAGRMGSPFIGRMGSPFIGNLRVGQDYAAQAAAQAQAQAEANARAAAQQAYNQAQYQSTMPDYASQSSQQQYDYYSNQPAPIPNFDSYSHQPPPEPPVVVYEPPPEPPPQYNIPYYPPNETPVVEPPVYVEPTPIYDTPVYIEPSPPVYVEPTPVYDTTPVPYVEPIPGPYSEPIPGYSPNCPPIIPVCETSSRRYFLGLAQDAVGAGQQILITVRPQYLVRFDRLVIPSNIGQFFDLNSLSIGNIPQSVAAGINSGVVFSEVATYVELGLDTAYPGIDIVLTVTNIDAQPRNFRATLFGVLVA